MKYPFQHHFLVCTGARCDDAKHGKNSGLSIRDELKDLNKARGRKPTVRICSVSCLDLCDYGPNMIAWPSGTIYSHLDVAKAVQAYEGVMGDARETPELELSEEELRNEKVKVKNQ
jgi:(2Fe-2S) ferredoxin